ncbi:unnamed protein product [Brassica oleracea]|uniref:(rape) hypothetical protein n=1 Tax=Brassica napus TaxID=3708 RepID=A0A816REL5_BRANA|nr:unnamed protein product [Brassica napus]
MANRRVSSRTRKVATKMAAALTSTDNRTQAAIARLEALENDNGALEVFCSYNIPNPLSKTSPPIYPHQAHNQDH